MWQYARTEDELEEGRIGLFESVCVMGSRKLKIAYHWYEYNKETLLRSSLLLPTEEKSETTAKLYGYKKETLLQSNLQLPTREKKSEVAKLFLLNLIF